MLWFKEDEMKKGLLMGAALAAMTCAMTVWAVGDQAIPEDSLGLSKDSVYDSPSPPAFDYTAPDVGTTNVRAVRSYPTAPPMIVHSIDGMLPITQENNMCKDCHVQPEMIGKKIEPGMPVPAPASHYVDVKKGDFYMGRWNCVQCHRPQADIKPIVVNTFGQQAKTVKVK
jgi:cytochrome c-type protein NapB